VFPLLGAALALVLERGLKESLKDRQAWVIAGLSIVPVGLYTLYGVYIGEFLGGQFAFRFFPELWKTAAFYLQWKGQLEGVFGFGAVVVALVGVAVARRRTFAFLAGLWIGYIVYGMTFTYHITTHDYYQMPLIPILAMSLAPVAETLLDRAAELRNARFIRMVTALGIAILVALQLWTVRVELARNDYRSDAAYQASIGDILGHTLEPVISLAQDYGGRLAYWGWQPNISWYDDSQLELRQMAGRDIDLATRFSEIVKDKRFFVVTHLASLESDSYLKATLYNNYPVYAEGKGFVIFDLAHPKTVSP
jgi:hypothetical protein